MEEEEEVEVMVPLLLLLPYYSERGTEISVSVTQKNSRRMRSTVDKLQVVLLRTSGTTTTIASNNSY